MLDFTLINLDASLHSVPSLIVFMCRHGDLLADIMILRQLPFESVAAIESCCSSPFKREPAIRNAVADSL